MVRDPECLFCKIVSRNIPARTLSESDDWLAFHDVHPQAPFHCLIVPKLHIPNLTEVPAGRSALIGEMLTELARLAKKHGFAGSGFRIVNNCNSDGGQTVGHLHFHLLAGRPMRWPPG